MNPTLHLLCAALRPEPDETPRHLLRRVAGDEWKPIVDLAVFHGVVPVLYEAVRARKPEVRIPPECLERMRRIYLTASACNMRLFHALGGVLAVFKQYAVPVTLLKGAHLASEIYASPGLRTMGDVDVLLYEHDLPRAEQLLLDLGAEPEDSRRIKTDDNQHFGYIFKNNGLRLENHWTLNASIKHRLDIEAIWARTRPATHFPGARLLSPEDLLLHLCLHAAGHLYALRLRAIYDVTLVIAREAPVISWTEFCARARAWRISRAAYGMLRLAQTWLGANVPEATFAALEPGPSATNQIDSMKKILIDSGSEANRAVVPIGLARLWAQGGGMARIRYGLRLLVTSPENMRRMYNAPAGKWRQLCYYPRRIGDLLRRHGPAGWRLLRGDIQARALAARKQETDRLQQWLLDG